jgi:hypothetical protein
MIRGVDAMVELALPAGAFTKSGLPYSDATPDHPGIIFRVRKPVTNPKGKQDMVPLYFPAGQYLSWKANLRAVGLAMEALRMIDRYGVTQNSQQYLGFGKYLPGPTHTGVLTLEQAARFVASHSGFMWPELINSNDSWRSGYRIAAAKLHPDAGGTSDQWEQLLAAKTLLDDHHNPKA